MDTLEPRAVLARDTSREAERLQIDRWRSMTVAERVTIIASTSRAVRSLALAGIRTRHPEATDQQLIAHLALLTLGPTLARMVYPELLPAPTTSP